MSNMHKVIISILFSLHFPGIISVFFHHRRHGRRRLFFIFHLLRRSLCLIFHFISGELWLINNASMLIFLCLFLAAAHPCQTNDGIIWQRSIILFSFFPLWLIFNLPPALRVLFCMFSQREKKLYDLRQITGTWRRLQWRQLHDHFQSPWKFFEAKHGN